MTGISIGRFRGIALRPERRRFLLQQGLIEHYRAWPTYHARVTMDLRPLWRRLEPRYSWAWHTSFHVAEALAEDQRWEEEDGIGSHDADLRAYVTAINSTVTDLMGLRVNGEIAPWACEYVHLDATSRYPVGQVVGPAYADFPKWERVQITLDVSEDRARLIVENHDGSVSAGPEISAQPYFSFTNWAELRARAHELLDSELDRLQGTFEETYTRGYASRLMSEQERLPTLRKALTATPRNRPSHDPAVWKALDRLCDGIGMDHPRR